jgi:hypothetical protein
MKVTARSIYKNWPIAFFVIVGVVIGYRAILLKKDHQLTIGVVTSIDVSGYKSGGDYSINYEYFVNGQKYSDNYNSDFCSGQSIHKLNELLSGRRFPVAYSTRYPGDGVILITEGMAKKYNFVLPDSLKKYDSLVTCKGI